MPTIINPILWYTHLSEQQILESIGVLLPWALEYDPDATDESLKQYMFERYRWPVSLVIEATLGTDLVVRYPLDPDLYPLAVHVALNMQAVSFYPHAIVCFHDVPLTKDAANRAIITRMD